MTLLQQGSVFAGRYRVLRQIATGGMGAVYEVLHVETERRRALKVMHANFVERPDLRERFRLEAKVAAQIDSEFIVDVFDAGIDEATQMPFLVMELLKGEELSKRLLRTGRMLPQEALAYLWQTALALDKTHKANVVHRDLKPENLFLTEREDGPPRVKVLDFGIAKFVAETASQGASTRSVGTPLYMSPEQFRARAVTPATDSFALGLIAYTLVVGMAYWAREASDATDVVSFALQAHAGPVVEPATVRAARAGVSLPPAFDEWFAAATAGDPGSRFPSATATVAALARVFGIEVGQLGRSAGTGANAGASDPELPGEAGAVANARSQPGQVAPTVVTSPPAIAPSISGTVDPTMLVAKEVKSGRSKAGLWLALTGVLVAIAGGGAIFFLNSKSHPARSKSSSHARNEASTTAPLPIETTASASPPTVQPTPVPPSPSAPIIPSSATAAPSATKPQKPPPVIRFPTTAAPPPTVPPIDPARPPPNIHSRD